MCVLLQNVIVQYIMAKQVTNNWRQSASLLLLARKQTKEPKSFDYNTLLLQRNAKSSFMPNSMVFPGGVRESADAEAAWLKHFKSFGISVAQLKLLASTRGPRPQMFTTNESQVIESAIALRLTAIRETFEEVGIILCRPRNDKDITKTQNGYATFKEDFDREHWQNLVHNDASQFLRLCQELDVVPDIWNLHEWSAWLTPSTFNKRFVTAFYLVPLQQTPNVIAEKHEVASYAWRTPLEYLKAALNKELWLPPPQFYELSRCLNFTDLAKLCDFAAKRVDNGLQLMHPVQFACTDGIVHLLPGDDKYPKLPDEFSERIETGLSISQFREGTTKLHRSEHLNQHESTLQINFKSIDGQLCPLDPRKISLGF